MALSSNKYFSQAPVAKEWKRSVFPITPKETTNYTSFSLGDLVPLYKPIEVIPHDTFQCDLRSMIRMPSAIKSPFMDGLVFDAYAFYVPKRLVWDYTAEFYGENSSAGARNTERLMPRADIRFFNYHKFPNGNVDTVTEDNYQKTVASHLGIPYVPASTSPYSAASCNLVNVLPLRAYWLIWNWYFRDQNLQNEVIINTAGDGDETTTNYDTATAFNGAHVTASYRYCYGLQLPLAKACKKHDYFTSMLPFAEKTVNPITLPLGDTAPVVFSQSDTTASGAENIGAETYISGDPSTVRIYKGASGDENYVTGEVDLSAATAASIQLLREALALHRLLEIDAVGGTRYDEQIFAHFGARPNALSYKPELLGEAHFNINVDQVVAHAGSTDESLGDVGAYSVSGNNSSLIMKSFTEPGYIIVVGVARQTTHIYSQGLDPLWSRSRRFDEFYPEFANFGLVPAYKREIMAGVEHDDVFGYKEYGSEHRYFTPMVTGVLNPNRTNSLDYWTLADELPTNVALSDTFIKEDSSNLERALIVQGQDQFVARFALTGKMVRVVPVHSLPKMVG